MNDPEVRAREVAAADDYAAAFDEWESSGDAMAWESVTADGLLIRFHPSL